MIEIKESNITLMVADMDRSIQFYESIGLILKHRWENHYAMISSPGVVIGLHPMEEGQSYKPSESISIGFMIEKAEEAEDLLKKLKISYQRSEGKSGIYLRFTDPDGTALYYTQPHWNY